VKKSADAKFSLPSLADRLRERIASGAWPPGTQLRQDRIAEEFGTSHIPVREAFVQLQASGFVTIVPNRGAFVSAMTADEAEELTAMRVALELLALDTAIDAFGSEDARAAEAILERDAHARDVEAWSADNWAFHRAIYAAGGKRHLLETLDGLWRKADRYLRLVWQIERYQGTSLAEHRAILDAVMAKDRRAAKRLTKAHIAAAGAVMREALRARSVGGGQP
jgi:DNA-binding GntR family transcriptional regulator